MYLLPNFREADWSMVRGWLMHSKENLWKNVNWRSILSAISTPRISMKSLALTRDRLSLYTTRYRQKVRSYSIEKPVLLIFPEKNNRTKWRYSVLFQQPTFRRRISRSKQTGWPGGNSRN